MASLASNSIAELAHKTVLMSKFCTSGGAGGEDNMGEVKSREGKRWGIRNGQGGVANKRVWDECDRHVEAPLARVTLKGLRSVFAKS